MFLLEKKQGPRPGVPKIYKHDMTQMRVHLPMTIQALPGANGPLPNGPLVPSDVCTGLDSTWNPLTCLSPGPGRRVLSAYSLSA